MERGERLFFEGGWKDGVLRRAQDERIKDEIAALHFIALIIMKKRRQKILFSFS